MRNFELIDVDIKDIELDIDNFRTGDIKDEFEEVSQKQQELFLKLDIDPYNNLKAGILGYGGIYDPIRITFSSSKNKKYIVREGNTRLTIYRELVKTDPKFQKIPCILDENENEEQTLKMLTMAHGLGQNPHIPFCRARGFKILREEKNFPDIKIAEYTKKTAKEIRMEIETYEIMEEFYKPACKKYKKKYDKTMWSAFYEYTIRREDIDQRANITPAEFSKFVCQGLLKPQSVVRSLADILENDDLKRVFLKSGGKAALEEKTLLEKGVINHKDFLLTDLLEVTRKKIDDINPSEDRAIAKEGVTGKIYNQLESLNESLDSVRERIGKLLGFKK